MVEDAAGRRSGTCRRRPSGGGERQLLHQRLVAVVMAATGPAAGASGAEGGSGGRCLEDFFDCMLGVLRALGLTWVAARPSKGEPCTAPPRAVAGAAPMDARRLAAELRGIPGRIAGNGASAVASLYTLQGKKGVNQDAMILWEVKETSLPCFLASTSPHLRFLLYLVFYCFTICLDLYTWD
jgi:hypothetical protein